MSYTDDRISRLESRQTAIDAALDAFEEGIEDYQIGSVRYRRSQIGQLENERNRIDGQLSKLYALKQGGGRAYLRHGRIN